MRSNFLIIGMVSLLILSCNQQLKGTTETASNGVSKHQHQAEAIQLNKGKKWKVDANMMIHIRSMEKDITDFGTAKQKNYKSLAETLQKNIDLLTSDCTMKGKAHDELHKWLLPYIDLVKGLSEAKNESEAEKKFENIQTAFTTFNKYFQ